MPANLENSAVATGLEKVNFHSNSSKGNAKECPNYRSVVLISHAGKVLLKILQVRLQKYVNQELPDIQAGFRKGSETRDKIPNICWIIEKAREFHKNVYFCFIDYAKVFHCVDDNKLENSWRWEYQTTLPTSWETCMQAKKQQLELDMKQRLIQNWERSITRLYIVTLLI